jgi:serine/threonine-protein kinase
MLTGRPPFTDNDAIVVMARHIKTAPKLPTEACPEASIPVELESAVMRALAKEPKQRPGTAEQMSADLARALDQGAAVSSGVRSVRPASSVPPPAIPPSPITGPIDDPADLPDFAPRRRGLFLTVGAIVLVASVVGLGVAVMRRSTRPRQAAVTSATVPPTAVTAEPTPPAATAADPAVARPGPTTPTISADSLPRASSKTPRSPRPSGGSSKPTPTAAPTASSRYGIFE